MILIIHECNYFESKFTDYLIKNEIDFYSISLERLINKVRIKDYFIDYKNSHCIWEIDENVLDLSKIDGILCLFDSINELYFENFSRDDREYARFEWEAYIIYRFNLINKVVNPLIIDSSIFQFPNIYNSANELGFTTPKYYISTNHERLMDYARNLNSYISTDNFYQFSSTKKNFISKNDVAIIEYINGAPLIIYIVGNNIFASIIFREKIINIELDNKLKEMCFNLCNKLNLFMCEICLKKTITNDYYLIYLKQLSNLNLFNYDKDELWESIIKIFYHDFKSKIREPKLKSFISKEFRPEIKGQFITSNH